MWRKKEDWSVGRCLRQMWRHRKGDPKESMCRMSGQRRIWEAMPQMWWIWREGPNCRGKRSFDVTLSFKRRICDTCDGRGKVICDACSGRRKETVHCRKCDGVGFIETTVVCSSCKGTGNGRTKVDCPNCNGTGKEMCSVCSGRGFTYKEDSPSSVQKDAMDARAIVNPVTNASPASCR